jgi:tetratricopeptide (TPR) repeat protein
MPDTDSVLKLSEDPLSLFQDIELSPQDKKILSLIDGRKSIKEIIDNSWMGSFEALRILYVLWSIGMIEQAAMQKKALKPSKTTGKPKVVKLNEGGRAEDLFKKGVKELKKGNFPGAIDNFALVLNLEPDNTNYLSHLSLAYSKVPGRMKEAEEVLLKAIKLEPFNADLYANLGLIYIKAELKKKAQSSFQKALKIDPQHDKAKKGLEQIKS